MEIAMGQDGFAKPLRGEYPFIYRVARWLCKQGIRGGCRLVSIAEARGLLDIVVRTRITEGRDFFLPLYLYPFDYMFPTEYEEKVVDAVVPAIASFTRTRMVDCGADIGLTGQLLASHVKDLKSVTAFEPNADVYDLLKANLAALNVQYQHFEGAVSEFVGNARLCSPPNDPSPHARFIVPDDDGPIAVTTVDEVVSLDPGDSLLLKIDVEGAEMQVLNGAEKAIRTAARFCIVLEANRRQVDRVGVDPTELVNAISRSRQATVVVAEHTELSLDLTRPFFDQVGAGHDVYNLVVCSA